MSSGVKFRCYPTPKQGEALSQWIGCQRFIYNAKVGEDRYFRTFRNHTLALTGVPAPVDQQYSRFKSKELTSFLYEVPSQILRNGATLFMRAYQRYWNDLAGRPAFHKKSGRQTVWITNDLFRFESTGKAKQKQNKTVYDHKLVLGTKSFPLGELKFKAHDEYELPATITISRNNRKWYVSFSYENQSTVMSEEELLDLYGGMAGQDLETITLGMDRGVVVPLATSTGDRHDFSDIQKKRLFQKDLRKKRYQRQMARRKKGSGHWKRSVGDVSRCSAYSANVREDFAHKASRKLVDSAAEVFVFEDLKVKNMTKAPKPKKADNGEYLPNGAAAKAGLNKAILESAWGKVKLFTTYKARRRNKLVIVIPAHGTSQECSKCSHTHPDNRISQAVFECLNCGFTENADVNASRVIKKRGIAKLTAGELSVKQKKRTMRLKNKKQLGREPAEVNARGEAIRRAVGSAQRSHASSIRETPTATA